MTKEFKLYDFSKLAKLLTQHGYPEPTKSDFRVIKRDLTREELAGNIDFRRDGIYLKIDGKEYKGYMYLKYPDLKKYGFPRFHITNCKTVLQQRERRLFDDRYFWQNSKTVTIEDRVNRQVHEDVTLQLCGNCRQESSIVEYRDTKGFFNLLDQQEIEETKKEIKIDAFGRPIDWDKISKEYRKEQNYTCEKCGFGGDMLESRLDREFIHTDHIVAWELANMRSKNLQCLCILCYSQKDEIQKANYSKPGMQKRIQRFLNKYRAKLIELGNEYIDNI